MSRVYVMNKPDTTIKERVLSSKQTKLSIFHRPIDVDGKASLWPYAVTDGKNYGWFEGSQILFWGSNSEIPILNELEKLGFYVTDAF